MKQLKNNIPEMLKAADMSISKLGRLADISYPTIQTLCTAEEMPNVEIVTLRKIAGVFECKVIELWDEVNNDLDNGCLSTCPNCGKDTMQVVRPGKFQCSECG